MENNKRLLTTTHFIQVYHSISILRASDFDRPICQRLAGIWNVLMPNHRRDNNKITGGKMTFLCVLDHTAYPLAGIARLLSPYFLASAEYTMTRSNDRNIIELFMDLNIARLCSDAYKIGLIVSAPPQGFSYQTRRSS